MLLNFQKREVHSKGRSFKLTLDIRELMTKFFGDQRGSYKKA